MNIPPQYRTATIEEQPKHMKAIFDWLVADLPGLMTLTGPCGTGKTRMLYAITQKSADPRMWDVPTLVVKTQRAARMVPDGAYSYHEIRRIDKLIDHNQLVALDDLGAEKTTDFVLQELYRLISQRELWGKPTLITTNLSLDTLAKKLDDRIVSRMAGGIVLEFSGADRRIKEAN